MVSFTQRHLAIMTMEVTMLDAEAPVVISSQTLNRREAATSTTYDPPRWAPEPIRARVRLRGSGARATKPLVARSADHSRLSLRELQDDLAVGVDHQIMTDNDYRTFISADEDTGKMVFRVQAKSADQGHEGCCLPPAECLLARLVDRCRRTLDG